MSNENTLFSQLSVAMSDAATRAGNAIVLVDGRQRLPASGIAFAPDLILTADHVVERDEEIRVVLPDGKEISAEVAGRDPGSDLAVLRLNENAATPAETTENEVRVGQLVLALGRPSPNGIEASLGVVSAVGGPARTHQGGLLERFIRTDAIPLPGFSGGPLVSAEGRVIGINTSGFGHGMLLTIPAPEAWKTAESLAKHGGVKRGFLGIRSQLVEIPEAARPSLNRQQDSGLLIVNIESDSPSAVAGLMVGDILVGVAGSPVADHDELLNRLTGDIVGKPTPVEVLRGGRLQTVKVTIAERVFKHSSEHGHPGHHGHHGG
jgi:S1-C subfamily serine protease